MFHRQESAVQQNLLDLTRPVLCDWCPWLDVTGTDAAYNSMSFTLFGMMTAHHYEFTWRTSVIMLQHSYNTLNITQSEQRCAECRSSSFGFVVYNLLSTGGNRILLCEPTTKNERWLLKAAVFVIWILEINSNDSKNHLIDTWSKYMTCLKMCVIEIETTSNIEKEASKRVRFLAA